MAITTLRAYLDDLEKLLDQEAMEETIGHCKYILQRFPKNVETYRLLGRALLGKARYQEASDVFQRVLSALPNDYVSHIAMSEIYREQSESAIPQATWHLERAYEQEPNNQVLQDELKRLYDMRDGDMPERLQMTRGGLARLYARGQLYEQATAELQAALDQQPERYDLWLLLAEVFWNNAHPVEAGETALRVLQTLPDAVEANRILAQLWLSNQRPSDAEPFLKRLEALDPFAALKILRPDNPEAADALQLPKLDWNQRSTAAMLSDSPDWVQGMGDMFPAEQNQGNAGFDPFGLQKSGGATPDWMTNFAAPSETPIEEPDWFSGVAASNNQPVNDYASNEPTGTPDVPDWFSDFSASSATATTPTAANESTSGGGIPSWLTDDLDEPTNTAPAPSSSGFTGLLNEITARKGVESGISQVPSWLDDDDPAESTSTPEPNISHDDYFASLQTSDSSVSDWMSDMTASSSDSTVGSTGGFDWLAEQSSPAQPAEPETPASAELPDWMNDFAPAAESATPEPVAAQTDEDDWLSNLGGLSDAQPAEPETPASAELPDWINDFAPAAETATPEPVAAQTSDDDWLSNLSGLSDVQPAEPEAPAQAEIPDWMNDFAPATEAATPEPVAAQTDEDDWLSNLSGLSDAQPEAVSVEDVLTNASPEMMGDDLLDWMSSPSATDTISEPAVSASPELDESDDWLKDFVSPEVDTDDDQQMVALGTNGSDENSESDDPLDWMSPSPETSSTAQPTIASSDNDWFSNLNITPMAEANAEPVQSQTQDWMSSASEPQIEDDWLSSFEPEAATIESQLAVSESSEWLDSLASVAPIPEQAAIESADVQEMMAAPDEAEDDWITRFSMTEAVITPPEELESPADEVPAWLSEMPSIEGAEAPTALDVSVEPSTSTPETTTDVPGRTTVLRPPTSSEIRRSNETGVLDPSLLPDWMKAFSEESSVAAEVSTPEPELTMPETMAAEPEPQAEIETEIDIAPEMFDNFDGFNAAAMEEVDESPIIGEMTPAWARQPSTRTTSEKPPESKPISVLPIEENFDPTALPDWLSAMAPVPENEMDSEPITADDETAQVVADLTPESSTTDDQVPDWLSAMDEAESPAPMEPISESSFENAFDDLDLFGAEQSEPTAEAVPAAERDMLSDWLSEATDEPLATAPALSLDDLDFGTPDSTTDSYSAFDDLADLPDLPDLPALSKAELAQPDQNVNTNSAESDETELAFTFERPPAWLRKKRQ